MEERPSFDTIKSYADFSKYYWYREELIEICRKLGIDSSGLKAELNHNIEEYFKGNLILPKAKENNRKKSTGNISIEDLSMETSLIKCGFSFGPKFRDFFSAQTGIKNFKFNVDMVASVKKARETNDVNFTLGDLLDIFHGKITYAKYDKISLQWNKFVHDFCADPATKNFPDKLKTAAIIWKEVRESSREKIYRHELLDEFADKINAD